MWTDLRMDERGAHSTTAQSPGRFGFELMPGAELADWSAIAACWDAGLERTVARCRGLDAPFCHAEHGNMHALMAGAEASGWSTMREVIGSRDHAGGPLGRLDGCFIGDSFVDLVEAKSAEAPLRPSGLLPRVKFKAVQNMMHDATIDAGRYFNGHSMFSTESPFALPRRRIAVVFSAGWFADEPNSIELWLAARLEQMRTVDHDAMAWSHPPSARKLRYWKRYYPGVVMLAKVVRIEPCAAPGA
jgi:hypothetical protein